MSNRESAFTYPPDKNGTTFSRKTTAILEVIGVFVAGNFLAGQLYPLLGIKSLGDLFQSAATPSGPDFIALSIGWMKMVGVQYACLLIPAFLIGWRRRRMALAQYGVTSAGHSLWSLALIGLLAFAFAALPFKMLWLAKEFVPLGPEPPMWALLDKSWTPAFCIFLAVSSFALNPILEELFYRGYCQSRLEEDFGGMGAIVIVALFLTLGHNQYHHASILSIGTIVGLVPLNLAMGYVCWRTRSLLPSIVIHGCVNLPTKGIYDYLLPPIMIIALILFRSKWLPMLRDFCRELMKRAWMPSACAATLLACAGVIGYETWPGKVAPLGVAALAAALVMEYRNSRAEKKNAFAKSFEA